MSDVSGLEQQLANAKLLIEKRDIAIRLSKNPDFRKLILDEFMVTECARYAQASADPALSVSERADALAISQASGHLKRYLSVIYQMANAAENQLVNIEEALAEARIEEGAE